MQLLRKSGTLKIHISLVNENLKKFSCDICKNYYSTIDNLEHHIKQIHYKMAGNYQCGVCNKLFTSRGAFIYHVKKHNEKRIIPN